MHEPLAFALLGTPVLAHSPDAAARARLVACYGHCAIDPAATGAIDGRLEPRSDGFAIAVDGRPAATAGDLVAAVRAFNHELMHALMLRNPHLRFVHAGVVARGGRAIVLPGLSRSGKSTLVLALVREGARLLSDELLAFDPAAGRLLPFARAVKIRDECLPAFPELADRFVGEGEGRFLPLGALGPTCVAPHAAPALLAAPRWDAAGDDTPRPITPGEGLLQLARSALNFGTRRERSIDDLATLAGASACFTLAWRAPRAAARALLRCLEQVTA